MLVLREVCKTYTRFGYQTRALDKVNLKLYRGEILGLVGHRGAGKSTLLGCLNGLVCPDCGTVDMDGQAVHTYSGAQLRQYRFKVGTFSATAPLLRRLSVATNIALPLRFCGWPLQDRQQRCQKLLEICQLQDLASRCGGDLTLWQRQRVALARAMAYRPQLLLCDCTLLAREHHEAWVGLLKNFCQQENITVVIASRSFSLVTATCGKVGIMSQGRLVENNEVRKILIAPQHAITYDYVQWSMCGKRQA